jgi:hypothetical protein
LFTLGGSGAGHILTEHRFAAGAGAQVTEVVFGTFVAIIALTLKGRIVDDLSFLAIVVGAGVAVVQV